MSDRLRALPSVDRLAIAVARAELADRRAELLAGADDDPDLVARARARLRPSLRRVLNATGVVVHTNLGRAPLSAAARAAVARVAEGYANLELDLERGERASRHAPRRRRCCASSPAPRPPPWSTTAPPPCCWPWRRWPAASARWSSPAGS